MFHTVKGRARFAALAGEVALTLALGSLAASCNRASAETAAAQADLDAKRREAREILAELRRRSGGGGTSEMPPPGPHVTSKGIRPSSLPSELPSALGRFGGIDTPELWRRFKQTIEPLRINDMDVRWPLPEVPPPSGTRPPTPDLKPPSKAVEQLALTPAVLRNAQGVAAVFPVGRVRELDDGHVELDTPSARDLRGLCADERFADLPAGAECTAFLVSRNRVATAAHCVDPYGRNGARAQDLRFVFGYRQPGATVGTWVVPKANVYRGAALKSWKPAPSPRDPFPEWAIVELDRPVTDRQHLTLAAPSMVARNSPVYVLGHPLGLPLIFDGGAKRVVKVSKDGTFDTNLDTYQGNSGSPVFSEKTHEVVGMLVWGEQDFPAVRVGDCKHSIACVVADCGREVCTDVGQFASQAN